MSLINPSRLGALCLLLTLLLLPLRWQPLQPVVTAAAGATFVDPTASLSFRGNIYLGEHVYIGPFATLRAGYFSPTRAISVGNESNVQDSATLDASLASVTLGDEAIVAHGGTVRGAANLLAGVGSARGVFPAQLGVGGQCPDGAKHCPSFVSFNALVEGATVQMDAMVGALARVGPGVTIPSGFKVLPGKNIVSNSDLNLSSGKIAPVTEADREFMRGVVEVNVCFAETYSQMAKSNPDSLTGINFNPGHCPFNEEAHLPTLAHHATQNAGFRNRIIGEVELENTLAELDKVMGVRISLRADEGEPFEVGTITAMADGVVFHALEHSHLHLGGQGNYGFRSIVHGGPTDFEGFKDTTVTGDNFVLGARSVFFRSRIGANSKVGFKSLVQQSDLPDNTTIGDRKIIINNVEAGVVEW
jgi:carbonic anhydrase/acetyltransferase-like protein (isoleucine patch superfamily)